MNRPTRLLLSLLALGLAWLPQGASAGPFQRMISITGDPSPVPGEFIANLAVRKWDARCASIGFYVDSSVDPIPNPLGPSFLRVADVVETFRRAAAQWTAIPTSFVDLHIDGTVDHPGPAGFDQVNEITFRANPTFGNSIPLLNFALDFGAIAFNRSTTLLVDAEIPPDLDLDGDGDLDTSAATTSCADIDGDGDFELPVGPMVGGTILDTDLVFVADPAGVPGLEPFRFTVRAADADTDPRSADLGGLALQYLGLAQGVAHSMINQKSDTDGSGSPMFPYLDTGDPATELGLRQLDLDAVTASSWLYPEGSATTGPAALGPGDIAFDRAFGLVEGEIRFGERDEPMAGGNVFAVDRATGRIVGSAISGTARYSVVPTGASATFLDPAYHILDGRYTLVLPPGSYDIGVEPPDGHPADFQAINLTSILNGFLHQGGFHEDYYDGPGESDLERFPNRRAAVRVRAGETTSGIDIVTNRTLDLGRFGSEDGLGAPGGPANRYYAVRIAGADFLAALASLAGRAVVHGAEFATGVADASVVPRFAEALLTTGRVAANGTAVLDLRHPLERAAPFVGQDDDFTPLYARDPVGLARRLEHELAEHPGEDVFLVLRQLEPPYPGVSRQPPQIGLDGGPDNDAPIYGDSYLSTHGRTFTPDPEHNFLFRLVLSEDPGH